MLFMYARLQMRLAERLLAPGEDPSMLEIVRSELDLGTLSPRAIMGVFRTVLYARDEPLITIATLLASAVHGMPETQQLPHENAMDLHMHLVAAFMAVETHWPRVMKLADEPLMRFVCYLTADWRPLWEACRPHDTDMLQRISHDRFETRETREWARANPMVI